MAKQFRSYDMNQQLLLPPDMRDWLPSGDIALSISDLVDTLDLSCIFDDYETADGRGNPPYHPRMMIKILIYGYVVGVRSSRKIAQSTYRDVAFRVLSGDQHPDHDSIANFRLRHLDKFQQLFKNVVLMAERLGLASLDHVAIDGTKIKANASRYKTYSHKTVCSREERLEKAIQAITDEADRIDKEEDDRFGPGNSGFEAPPHLRTMEQRLAAIKKLKAEMEEEARQIEAEAAEKADTHKQDKKRGRTPKRVPKDEALKRVRRRNLTDDDSRLVRDGSINWFIQGYNGQLAVNDQHFIVALSLTNQPDDHAQLLPLLDSIEEQLHARPAVVTADTGYYSSENLTAHQVEQIDLYVPPQSQMTGPLATAMREKLKCSKAKKIFGRRKALVETVNGKIKQILGFRQFSLRGLRKVTAEFNLVGIASNLHRIVYALAQPASVC
jgi:transposase